MQAAQTTGETLTISRDKLLSLVSQTFGGASGGREDDEHPAAHLDATLHFYIETFGADVIENGILFEGPATGIDAAHHGDARPVDALVAAAHHFFGPAGTTPVRLKVQLVFSRGV
jgi:hypothetical protein